MLKKKRKNGKKQKNVEKLQFNKTNVAKISDRARQ